MARELYNATGTTKDGAAWHISAAKLERPKDGILFWSAANGLVFEDILATERRAESRAALKRLFNRNQPTHGVKLVRVGRGPLFVQCLDLTSTRLTADATCVKVCELLHFMAEKMSGDDWMVQPGATASRFWHGVAIEAFLRVDSGGN